MAKKIPIKKLEEIIDSMGGIKEFHRRMEQHRKDFEYFDTHHEELLRDYKEEWVAVYNEEVVTHDKDFLNLLKKMDKEVRSNVVIQYVTSKKMIWILPSTQYKEALI